MNKPRAAKHFVYEESPHRYVVEFALHKQMSQYRMFVAQHLQAHDVFIFTLTGACSWHSGRAMFFVYEGISTWPPNNTDNHCQPLPVVTSFQCLEPALLFCCNHVGHIPKGAGFCRRTLRAARAIILYKHIYSFNKRNKSLVLQL